MAITPPPERYLAPYVSRLPGRAELGGIIAQASGGLAFAREGAADMVEVLQRTQAAWVDLAGRLDIPSLPPGVADASSELWSAVIDYSRGGSVGALRSAVVGAVGQAAYRALAAAGRSVPIMGWVVGMLMSAFEVGQAVWRANNTYEGPLALPPEYDPDTDAAWVQGGLDRLRATPERTSLFMPSVIGDDIFSARVAGGGGINRAWAIQGDQVGMGCVPGAGRVWQAWYYDTDTPAERNEGGGPKEATGAMPQGYDASYRRAWDDYHPGVRTAAALWWDACQVPGPAAWSVDTQAITQGWRDWASVLERHAAAGDRMTNRRAASVLFPLWASYRSTAECYYRPHPHKNGSACGVVGFVSRTMDLHRERLRKLAGTLSVAYVPEDAPALRDAGVRAVFEARRKQLLGHRAVRQVDAAAVPDAGYRTAVHQAQATMRPLTAAPGTPPAPAPAAKPATLPSLPGTPPGGVPPPTLPPGPSGGGVGLLLLAAVGLALAR